MIAKQKLLLGCAAAGLCVAAPSAKLAAQAFNATPKTVAGNVTYDRATPNVETVFVNTDSAIINWTPTAGTFLPAGNTATFSNGINNTSFAVLNRIISNTPVRFDGTVLGRIQDFAVGTSTPGGTVLFSSPGGIIIGPTGLFDVGNLVLTTLNVIDNAGDFGGTTGNYRFDSGPSPLNAAIVTMPGSQVTALNERSYVALVAPRIVHGGSVRANGSIAYVAGEALELRVNSGLFDIIVTTGSDNATPIMHTGSTGGPASTAADDIHRIYMVAVPKNQAITAVLQGNVGFDAAIAADIENGAIVLSAGHSIVGGVVDRFATASPAPLPDLAASFHIRGGRISSDLTGVAFTDMLASGQATGSLLFQQDVRLFANRRAHLFAGAGETVTVQGSASISADRFASADKNATDLTGGEALVFAQAGGTVTINGDTAVTAGAQGQSNAAGAVGSGTGGTAGIFADQGTVTLNREVFVDASGLGAKPPPGSPVGGNGTGGTAFVEGRNGGIVTINNSLDIFATGTASEASGSLPVTGATGLGGTIRFGTAGDGQVNVTGRVLAVADGFGGAVLDGAGNVGGQGRGGNILVTQTGGTINLGGLADWSANGFGGTGPAGGSGQGGTIVFDVAGAQFQFGGAATLAANGAGGDSNLTGGQGGSGRGGAVRFTARNGGAGARIAGGAIAVTATGAGGRGANFAAGTPAGDGGDGQGGDITLLAEAGNAVLDFGALTASADGLGGQGGGADNAVDGGDGGDGRGGNVTIGTAPTGAPTVTGSTRFTSVSLRANGIGGTGGLGRGTGGAGTGGTATISADGAPVQSLGATDLAANGTGGAGGADPTGGGPGGDGQAAGGAVNLAANGANGTLTAGTVNGTASATGATTTTNTPGQWHVTANAAGTVSLANLNLTAAANGTAAAPAFSSLEPLGGTIRVTGIANLITPGEIRVLANGAGSVTGGRYNLNAGADVTISHAAPLAGGFTIDVVDLFVVGGDDLDVGPGVVARTSGTTDLRVTDLASIAGQIRGNSVLLRAAALDVAASGALGDAGSVTTDAQVTGNASVAGQIGGQAILLRSAGLNIAGGGAIGSATTASVDIQATGTANIAGQVRGGTITLRSAGLDIGGTVGGAETTSADIGTTGNAAVSGQIQGATVRLGAGGTLDVAATGSIGTAATGSTNVQATGNATVAGQIQGQAIAVRSAGLNVAGTGAIGAAATTTVDIQATGTANIAGQLRGGTITLRSASLDIAGTVGGTETTLADAGATGNASVSGQIRGATVRLNAGGTLNVTATGSVGTAATGSANVQSAGNATVAGQIQGQNIVLRSAGLDLTGTGAIGSAATTSVDIQATGLANVAGQVRGGTIALRSASLDVGGTVGGTETGLADLGTTGNANVAGQVQGAAVKLAAGGTLNVATTGSVGTAATATTNVQSTGNATVAGQVQGQAIIVRSAGLNIAGTGAVGGAGTNSADLGATGAATIAGQVRGRNILLNAASLDLAASGSIGGGAATDVSDVRTAGNAAIAGQVTGQTVRITSSALNVAPTGLVGGTATSQAELRAAGTIGVSGRVLGTNLLLASADLDLPAGGAIGDAATQRVTLQPNAGGPTATLGGTAPGPGYTLTAAEAARIRTGTLRIDAPAVAGGNALLVRDITFNGGGATTGIGTLELATPGAIRVEGALLLANAAVGNGIAVNAGERIEISTPTGSIRVRNAAGAPGGTLTLTSANIWAAAPAILDRLRVNPAYAGRDAELLDDGGNLAPRGFIEGNAVTLSTSGTLFVQNTGPGRGTFLTGTEFGGVTVGPGGLTVRSTATPATVTIFGIRLNADGSVTNGDDFFFSGNFAATGTLAAGFTGNSTLNTCIIVTGQCPLRAPPGTGPSGPEPTTGPVGGSASILLPPGSDANDLVDTSFAAEGLIEEPVTSGGDNGLWETDCDRDNDGDCDEGGR